MGKNEHVSFSSATASYVSDWKRSQAAFLAQCGAIPAMVSHMESPYIATREVQVMLEGVQAFLKASLHCFGVGKAAKLTLRVLLQAGVSMQNLAFASAFQEAGLHQILDQFAVSVGIQLMSVSHDNLAY